MLPTSLIVIGVLSVLVQSSSLADSTSYSFAVDLSAPTTLNQLQCVKQAGYSAVFVRAFEPTGSGSLDTNACTTIQNAYRSNLGIEVYITPNPFSSMKGNQIVDEVYQGLEGCGTIIRSIWIQVVNPYYWPTNPTNNVEYIKTILARARQYGLTTGIYTTQNAWDQITNSYFNLSYDILLWYTNVTSGGVNGETPANFDDFRGFGNWRTPSIKQFAQQEQVCQITVNRNVYHAAGAIEEAGSGMENDGRIYVGGFVTGK